MLHYIYSIKNNINNKRYIGLTTNAKRRKKRHFSDLRCGRHDNIRLQRSFDKYGEENFIFEILLETNCSRDEINVIEEEYILKYDSYLNGYNLNRGGSQHNGFESKLSNDDVFDISSVIEFSSRSGAVLAEHFNTTTTTISRIKKGMSHLDYKLEYDKLPFDSRRLIFDNFCERTNYLNVKNKRTIIKSKRHFSQEQVLYILSMVEFGYRKIKSMEKFLSVKSGTIHAIKKRDSYQDYSDIYDKLSLEKKKELYHSAEIYFNFNVSSCRDAC